jgi:F-type H+-transporting ATPase subunit delta
MIPSAILGRYSRSLSDIVFEKGVEQKVTEDLGTFNEIFRAVPELLDVFHSPAVPRETKETLLGELAAKYPVSDVTFNFLRILLHHNRLRYFQQIMDGYLKSVNEHKGVVSARVSTAAPLSPQDLKKLEARLSEITGKLVSLELYTESDLLGGTVVQIGSTVFDGSIRTQLSEMGRRLTET